MLPISVCSVCGLRSVLMCADAGDYLYCPDHPKAPQIAINPAALLGAKGGAAKTAAKSKASAENGKKGGRPKTK